MITKDKVAYKVKQGTNKWLVYSYSTHYEMWVESNWPMSYASACNVVKTYKALWDTKTQKYEGVEV